MFFYPYGVSGRMPYYYRSLANCLNSDLTIYGRSPPIIVELRELDLSFVLLMRPGLTCAVRMLQDVLLMHFQLWRLCINGYNLLPHDDELSCIVSGPGAVLIQQYTNNSLYPCIRSTLLPRTPAPVLYMLL